MNTTCRMASATALAALLIASPAVAQTTVITPVPAPPAAVVVVPAAPTVVPVPDPVGMQPIHPPVTAAPSGFAPFDPAEYANGAPMTVTGRVDDVLNRDGVTSFRLQTPTEAWTIVVPPGQESMIGNSGSATVVGFPHVRTRNQLLAQSVTAGR